MPLSTKSSKLIVSSGKLATSCKCCCQLPDYGKLEWIGDPPASTSPVAMNGDTRLGFCACYWDTGIPLVKTSDCESYGGIPDAGLHHGRHGNLSPGSILGIDGTASGYPTWWDLDATQALSSAFSMSLPGQQYAYPSLRATSSALYLMPDLLFTGQPVLIGLHSQQNQKIVGATVPNAFIPGSGHAYEITSVTKQEANAIRESQKGRSLKYCDGSWIADSQKPWSITVDVNGFPPLGQPTPTLAFKQYWREQWSHKVTCDSLIASGSGLPLRWSLSQTVATGASAGEMFARGVETGISDNKEYASGEFRSHGLEIDANPVFPATAGCSGCDVKLVFNVSVTLSIAVGQIDGMFGDLVLYDTVYCDKQYSPCLSSGSTSWSVKPTRRVLRYGTSQGFGDFRIFYPYPGVVDVDPNPQDTVTFEV